MENNIIKQRREELCLTQKELADLLGRSTSSISAYEQGLRIPAPGARRKLIKILNIDVQALLALKVKAKEEPQ